jgi:MerR family transcriptional regulator/heat shock protein HspR
METAPRYTMSVAARLVGVPAHRLRMYEREGLLVPGRLGVRNRLYSDADLERARHIAELARQGINMAGIKAILVMEEESKNKAGGK